MKNNRGVTLASLSVYIIVSIIVLASLTFLNINFMSKIADLSKKSEKTNEILKVESYIIKDAKSAGRILEFSPHYLRLDNGVEYTIKYRSNEKNSDGQTYETYELYRGDVLVSDGLSNIEFDYGSPSIATEENENTEWIVLNVLDKNLTGGLINIKVGK